MCKLILLLAACCTIMSHASANQTIPSGLTLQPGVYRTKWVVPSESRALRDLCGKTRLQDDRSEGLAVPKFRSAHPKYGRLIIDANYETMAQIPFALDESKGTGKGYDVIYVDANRNGSLKDERRSSASVIRGRLSCYNAAAISHSMAYPGSKNPNLLAVDVFFPVSKGRIRDGNVYYRGTWVGELRSNKGSIPVMLRDGNQNGRYDNPQAKLSEFEAEGGDDILFDWTRSGRFPDYGDHKDPGHVALHSVMSIGGRLYVLKPSALGDKLDVEIYQGNTGRIGLRVSSVNGVPVRVLGDTPRIYTGSQVYELPTNGTPITVPAGSYNVSSLAFVPRSVAKPNWWFLYDSPDGVTVRNNSSGWITVGGRALLAFGAADDSFRAGESISLQVILSVGRGRLEMVRGRPQDRPAVIVTNASGKAVHSGSVEEAGGGDTGFTAEIPGTLKPGKYTVNVSWKNCPLGPMHARRQLLIR